MEVIENKSKYSRKETRWRKSLRILRKFIWVLPLLAIAGGLGIGGYMIRHIQAESPQLPEVKYERYLTPQERLKQKELKKLELYREKMKKEKQEEFSSRYERIISGSDLIGKANYGEVVVPGHPEEEKAEPLTEESDTKEPGSAEEISDAKDQEIPQPRKNKTASYQKKQPVPEEIPSPETSSPITLRDSLYMADSLKNAPAEDPFHTLRATAAAVAPFTRAHFYGDQDILNGSYVRLRLGEDMLVKGVRIPRNTVFRGIASLSQNKIEISIEQIGLQPIEGIVCDQDYTPGIVMPATRSGDMNQAISRSVYQQGSGSAMDIPFEILQDVSQNIIRNKRRKQSTIRINDGYPVFITQTKP